MFGLIREYIRKTRIRKYASDIETGLLPLSQVSTVNVVVDVEEPGFDALKEDILAWGRNTGLKVNLYFFDFRRLGKDELLLTSITNTLLKRELDWTGMPDLAKISPLIDSQSDLFISMVDNGDFPIDFTARCAKARFKVGRRDYEGHPYNLIVAGGETTDLISEVRQIYAAITEILTKIS